MIGGINTWAVGIVCYSAGVVNWTMEEMASMDSTARTILAMNGRLYTRSNVARLYLPRKEGRRGLIGIQECVIIAGQEQALRTNSIKHSVGKISETSLSRLRGESTETLWHIISGCRMRIGSATTRWPCGYTRRCVGNIG